MAQGGLLTPPPPSVRPPVSSAPSGVQRAAEAKADDSGVVDLALAAQSDPGAAARAKSTPLAQDGLFDDEPASMRPGPVAASLQQPMPSMPPFSQPPSIAPVSAAPISAAPVSAAPMSAPASAAAIAAPTPITAAPEKKKGGKGIALALTGLIALGAVAAGGFFVMKGIQAKRAAEAELAAAAAKAATPPPPVVAAAPEAKPAEPAPAPEATTDPNALPTAEPATAKLAAKAPASAGKPQALALNTPAPAPAKAEGPAKVSEKDIPTTPSGPGGDLGDAMKKSVGEKGAAEPTPAAGSNGPQFAAGTVPQKPSQGAVTGALGAVLPGARTCLGPDDPISRATITFASAGNVTGVNVSGGAAGKPAEACIKSALMKAKLAPFMEPTYTANVTIRHN
ncbi:MAG: hypothetical protein JST00_32425 [Deltaproteobacteria bacterium]|nr:hypothetical protein [Deltaproteobacteria bacterium]